MINKSIVLSTLVPNSTTDFSVLEESLSLLQKTSVDTIEYYTPFEKTKEAAKIIRDNGFNHIVYPIAGVQKGENYSLCTRDQINRKKAVDLILRAIESAESMGAEKVLITSGRYEGEGGLEELYKSMDEIMRNASSLCIVLEPGDRDKDAYQFLGPIKLSVEFAIEVRKSYPNFFLTLDTSHISELGEDVKKALKMGEDVSNHIHLATCVLKKGHPLFGDKHPFFSNPDVTITEEQIHEIYNQITKDATEKNKDLTIGCEIIDRFGERMGGLEKAIKEIPWYFK